MLLLTRRGTPLIYYGEEIGMTNVAIPPEYEQDLMERRIGLNRDPQCTPMQWDPGPYAGFSSHTTEKLWLPVSTNYRTVNVESELQDSHSMLNLYRKLIAYRKATPALQTGSFQSIEDVPPDCYLFIRQEGDLRVLVALNFAGQSCSVPVPQLGPGKIVLNTDLDRSGAVNLASLELGWKEGIVVQLRAP